MDLYKKYKESLIKKYSHEELCQRSVTSMLSGLCLSPVAAVASFHIFRKPVTAFLVFGAYLAGTMGASEFFLRVSREKIKR